MLTDADICAGANEQADRSGGASVIVRTPGPGEIEASAELVMPDAVRRNGRVLIQKRIRCPKLQALRLGKAIVKLIDRLKDRRQGIRG